MPKILIVDDEDYLCLMIKELLSFEGIDADTASNGKEAFEKAIVSAPDLILCDISMPVCNGFELLQAVRQDEELANVPFIFLTGHTDRAVMRQGMELGADDFLTKPFSQDELVAAVRTRLDRQRRLQELRTSSPADAALPGLFHVLPHEINTPLQKILGFSEILREDFDELSGEEVGDMADKIHRSAQRLQHLTENFLTFAQVQMAATDSDKREALAAAVLREARDIIADAAQVAVLDNGRREDLALQLDPASLRITDGNLRKIVAELVDNACKFSVKGRPIKVTGQAADGAYRLEISDQGRGMKPEEIEQIGAFRQFDRQLYEQQGMGLGLALTVQLADLHGGKVKIRSVPGQGTQVSVHIPVA